MPTVTQYEGDVIIRGALQVTGAATLGDGSILNAQVGAAAGITAAKLEHQHRPMYAQANAAAADETKVVHTVIGATGTIKSFKAGSIAVAIGDAKATVDLKKNGVSVLSPVITLDSDNEARVVEAGTLSDTTLAVGDVLEVVVDGTIGTGTLPTGVFACVDLYEDAD